MLTSLELWLKDIKVIYVEFGSEQDRKQIDRMRDPSHIIWRGIMSQGSQGCLCYLSRSYIPDGAND
ncbi:hypothetical protein [Synechococcus sp. B60.1]|uniref:hypothetical protein n=1 Tax=unclassified Synechococcus TaxID=2626047 RepID=UPI0039C0E09D